MGKRILSTILSMCLVITLFSFAGTTASAAQPVSDEVIQARIDELLELLDGKYFNTNQGDACGSKCSGHGCSACSVNAVMKTQWFQNMFGTVKPAQLFLSGGKSCMGFAEFAGWYLFRANDSDSVLRDQNAETYGKKYQFNQANISKYAHIGDYIRLTKSGDTGGHSVIYIGSNKDGIEVLDCNWSGTYNCKVQKHTIPYSNYVWCRINKLYSKENGKTALVNTCTVTFDPNGGGVTQTRKTVTQGALIGTVPTPTREGYQFLGWTETPTGSGMVVTSNSIYVNENITLYALWKPVAKTYTVTFDAKGGSVSKRTMTVTNGSTFGTLPTPVRDGYDFNGWWYDDDDSGVCVRVRSNTRVDLEQNITLYATWSKTPEETVCTEHKKGVYLYCDDEHPHYNSYMCSVCGKVFQDGSKKEVESCTVCNPVEETPVVCKTHTKGKLASTDGKHPHYNSYTCSVCGVKFKDGSTKKLTSCTVCYPKECEVHTKGEMLYCESAHPHRNYYECSVCGEEFTDGITNEVESCETCNPVSESVVCETHKKGSYRRSGPTHPHYNYYECSVCGEEFTDKSTASIPSCEDCWGEWSGWSAQKVTATSTRQVETKKVKVSDGYTEYRYGRYIDAKGAHDCWCGEYLESLAYVSGSAKLDYSDWSTTRYSENGKGWSCGYCDADHIGADKTESDGRSWWAEYVLPGSESYYWEESRKVDATYVTMYRYRELT